MLAVLAGNRATSKKTIVRHTVLEMNGAEIRAKRIAADISGDAVCRAANNFDRSRFSMNPHSVLDGFGISERNEA